MFSTLNSVISRFISRKKEQGERYTPHVVELPQKTESTISRLDFQSETWRAVIEHCHNRIAELRAKNDSMSLDETKTACIRGQIKECQNIVNLAKPKPQMYEEPEEKAGPLIFGRPT